MMWPKVDGEYREELQGIADGAKAAGVFNADRYRTDFQLMD